MVYNTYCFGTIEPRIELFTQLTNSIYLQQLQFRETITVSAVYDSKNPFLFQIMIMVPIKVTAGVSLLTNVENFSKYIQYLNSNG